VEWHNYERDHMSLDEGETPAEAYARKMTPRGGHGRAVGHLVQARVVGVHYFWDPTKNLKCPEP